MKSNYINQVNQNVQNNVVVKNLGIDVRKLNIDDSLTEQYANICQQHEINKKWILMINPEDQTLEKLTKTNKVDCSKILKVNTNKTRVNLKNIESALCKGNCSAVILCNPSLKNDELEQLNRCAIQGRTACVVLTDKQQLH